MGREYSALTVPKAWPDPRAGAEPEAQSRSPVQEAAKLVILVTDGKSQDDAHAAGHVLRVWVSTSLLWVSSSSLPGSQ